MLSIILITCYSLKLADTWRVSHLSWTVSSVNLVFPESPLFQCLIGTGCGVPGIMASRTIENDRDRRMTIMTTTFIPCGAKTTVYRNDCRCYLRRLSMGCYISLLHRYGGNYLLRYYFKENKIICRRSGTIRYGTSCLTTCPTVGTVLRSMWERGWSFIKKAGTIILLSTIVVWFTTYFGFSQTADSICLSEDEIDHQYSCIYRQCDCLDLCTTWLGQLAGNGGFCYRTCCKGKHRWYNGYSLRWRRTFNICGTGKTVYRTCRLLIPDIQPSLCSLLCSNRCD